MSGLEASLSPPRAVVLISIDSLRPDHLGAYGYGRDTSPAIDQLAADGVVFEDTMSTTSWTLPSHISMLTSLYPEVHGVTKGGLRLDERAVLISELLQPVGYQTAAFVLGPFVSRNFGYNQGFDHYDDKTIAAGRISESHRGITNERLHESVALWLDANARHSFPRSGSRTAGRSFPALRDRGAGVAPKATRPHSHEPGVPGSSEDLVASSVGRYPSRWPSADDGDRLVVGGYSW
jgi:arylsulfatase A-like enzyme